jgi:hypothetical protein
MIRTEKDEAREYRISTEAIVDAHDEEEQQWDGTITWMTRCVFSSWLNVLELQPNLP